MFSPSPEIVTAIATSMAAIAAIASAIVAYLTLKSDRFRERNKILIVKHQLEMEHMQKLIGAFAEVCCLEPMVWSDARSQGLDKTIEALQFHVTSLARISHQGEAGIGFFC